MEANDKKYEDKKWEEKVVELIRYLQSWTIKIIFFLAALVHESKARFLIYWGFAYYHKYHHNRNSKPIDELHDPPLRQLQAP